jgi:cystathionine beta-lyase/cystathionine gamma-synthase
MPGATRAVRAGIDRDPAYGAVTPPLVLSSNFSFAGFGEKRQYDYTRSGNPTRDLLGEALAELEGGAGGVITATGMGAITLVLNALLQPGDRLVVLTTATAEAGGCRRTGAKAVIGLATWLTGALAGRAKPTLGGSDPFRPHPTCAS